MAKAVRVGVLGLRRGAALARLAQQAEMQVVAVCERDRPRCEETASALGAVGYRDVEAFLSHAMDAVSSWSTTSTSMPLSPFARWTRA
jgi:predicted dehydrogenase